MTKNIAFTAYAVRDVPRAVAFYRDVLGLRVGEPFNATCVEFDDGSCNGVNFEVCFAKDPGGNGFALYLRRDKCSG